jgi:hypothetical protein
MEPEFLPDDCVKSGRPNPDRPKDGTCMRSAIAILAALWLGANTGTEAGAETLRFAISRNGDAIGTHRIEINRAGSETSVDIRTDLAVNVLFFPPTVFNKEPASVGSTAIWLRSIRPLITMGRDIRFL